MKLEKREIMLNETDSLTDVYYFEKILFQEYSARLTLAKRKEMKNELTALLQEVVKDIERMEGCVRQSVKNCALDG